ncbi:hypothetical protein LY76DRAFT_328423 [Colletotrichum caudatum]|nr:hypothetical protein LY76DRAFT_328423 [Colletotrichum caudatum]
MCVLMVLLSLLPAFLCRAPTPLCRRPKHQDKQQTSAQPFRHIHVEKKKRPTSSIKSSMPDLKLFLFFPFSVCASSASPLNDVVFVNSGLCGEIRW